MTEEERAATVDVAHMKNYIEGNMDQVVARVNAGAAAGATLSAIDIKSIVKEVLEAIKQVQDAARHYSEEDFASGTPRSGGPTDGRESQDT